MDIEKRRKVTGIIVAHCCMGCDGYQCPNNGQGNNIEETVDLIMSLFGEK